MRTLRYDLNQIPYDYTVESNRFRVLDLIDRMPEEPQTDTHNTVQEAVNKTIPKKNKCKIEKWFSEEALQISEERREKKSKGERERYSQLKAEFQRTARMDKAFYNEQCKEVEENNRMGKTGDLFRKIRDNKGKLHPRMGMIQDRNVMDLTETEEIKKRWQQQTEELYKMVLMT